MYEVYLINNLVYHMEGSVLMPCRPDKADKLFPKLVWLTFEEQGDYVVRIQTPTKILYNHPMFLVFLQELRSKGIDLTKLYWTTKPVHFMEIERG